MELFEFLDDGEEQEEPREFSALKLVINDRATSLAEMPSLAEEARMHSPGEKEELLTDILMAAVSRSQTYPVDFLEPEIVVAFRGKGFVEYSTNFANDAVLEAEPDAPEEFQKDASEEKGNEETKWKL